ncbi:hypothetical protein BGX38DRAFT_384418 [Terfezia claveryi]|nr:hypothetical protein BGX38DRAFT_384418 [Terfezia claveryi]
MGLSFVSFYGSAFWARLFNFLPALQAFGVFPPLPEFFPPVSGGEGSCSIFPTTFWLSFESRFNQASLGHQAQAVNNSMGPRLT